MNTKQKKALDLANQIANHELYSTHEKSNILYGIVRMSIDMKAWSLELEEIWRSFEPGAKS